MSDSPILIESLRNARCYPHPISRLDVIETHSSWVILTGEHAYKIKKSVDLGFLDYSTLEKRRQACYEELCLNSILAPELYMDVVPISGSAIQPHMNGEGDVIEYAVHMHEFDQRCQLDHMLKRGELRIEDMDVVAKHVAAFHTVAPILDPTRPYGRAWDIHKPIEDNFSTIVSLLAGKHMSEMENLRRWSDSEFQAKRNYMDARRNLGNVRECHGDLHLANLVKYHGRILAFDRIEFSEALRWIDVMNDSAFLVMDLLYHKRQDLAFRFLNSYLQSTGDYRGLAVLRYYLVYRALVRAKVALLKATQKGNTVSSASAKQDADLHIKLADFIIQPRQAQLILMHGLSGSGKTWLSDRLMTTLPAVRLRSDVERKRIHGQIIEAHSNSAPRDDLYTPAAAERTYRELAELAECVCCAGWSVIVDAAFLQKWQRQMFEDLATRLAIPWVILDCQAPVSVLSARVTQRLDMGLDASEANEAVLRHQLQTAQPLGVSERERSLRVETQSDIDVDVVGKNLLYRLGAL
ncbi:MAG: AAA family ATPase [Gammaproteobacteria bacterium]